MSIKRRKLEYRVPDDLTLVKEEDEEEMIEYVNKLRDDIDKKQAEYDKFVFLCEARYSHKDCQPYVTMKAPGPFINALLEKRKCEMIDMPEDKKTFNITLKAENAGLHPDRKSFNYCMTKRISKHNLIDMICKYYTICSNHCFIENIHVEESGNILLNIGS